jgi:eukaryotic-like serine/threonine-protein kinase
MSHDGRVPKPPKAALPPDWATLAPLLDRVLDAEPERRAAVLDEVSAGDATRRDVLARLVAECEQDLPVLDRPAAEQFADLAADEEALPLPPLLGGRYETGRELGRGGMARVFLARDIKHGRDVAVKVIRPELAASLGRGRFLREIEIAARLRHPNIVPLYDSGDAEGMLYFVMPYEDGPSLRARLAREGALPLPDALSMLRDVARALQYAHEHGVVHRDIKPDNVMMSGGAAVVTDFGIAKAVSAAQADAPTATITQTGSGIGTPAYMAPEQAIGDPSSDHRADIYSFGCLAYEVLTGSPPFHGMPVHQIVAAHMSTVPGLVTDSRAGIPASVGRLVAKCLAKDPAARPQNAGEVVAVLEGTATLGADELSPPQQQRRLVRPRIAVLSLLAVAAVIVAVAAYRLGGFGASAAPITIAVLPFGNITEDSATAPFADGLGDEVFTALERVPGLEMRSRTGARAYRGQLSVDPEEAGRKLKADYLVTGVLREARGRWVLSTELTRTADAAELWNETYDRSPAEQIGVAEEIARATAGVLRKRFPRSLGEAPALAPSQQTTNAEAYRLYVLGQELLSRRGQSVKGSADAFRQAMRLDSTYAGAYAGLSMALALYPYFELTPAKDVEAELTSSAQKAIRFDSTLAQPHIALGLGAAHRYEWELSGAEFRKALSLAPTDVEAHVQYGRHLLRLGRDGEALQQLQVARREDPASALVLSWVSAAFRLLGQRDSALVASAQALQGNVLNYTAAMNAAHILLEAGLRDSARAVAGRLTVMVPTRAYIMGATGDSARAWAEIRTMHTRFPRNASGKSTEAFLWLGVGDTTRALALLEQATDDHEMWPELDSVDDAMFAHVRESPRFRTVVRRVGLPLSMVDNARRLRR